MTNGKEKFQWPPTPDSGKVIDSSMLMQDGRIRKIQKHWFHVQCTASDGSLFLAIGAEGKPEEFPHYHEAAKLRDSLEDGLQPKVLKVAVKFTTSIVGPFETDGVVWERD